MEMVTDGGGGVGEGGVKGRSLKEEMRMHLAVQD